MNDLIFTPDEPVSEEFAFLSKGHALPTKVNIPKQLIDLDGSELRQMGWWDYRFMSGAERTMQFAEEFGKAARRIYAREVDSTIGEHTYGDATRQGFIRVASVCLDACAKPDKVRAAKIATSGMWKARQVADLLEMPYELFSAEALRHRMRWWHGSYTYEKKLKGGKTSTRVVRGVMPKPAQLCIDWVVEHVSEFWEQTKVARIMYAEHEAFIPGNYQSLPVQKDYAKHLIARARRTPDPYETIANMIRNDRLPYEAVEELVEQEGFERVRKFLM